MPSPLDVLILGPVVARAGGAVVRVDRPLECALLVRLALAGGAPVPDERLAADLWGVAELARPTERLRVLASRLRAALATDTGALRRTPGGYALEAGTSDLAEARRAAERLHAAARDGDHRLARSAAAQALALWRGPALAGLRSIPFAGAEGEWLDAWRVDLLVERLTADLALGAAAEVSAELERLAGGHPLHERLWCLLALALYRTGRQADALDRLARLRRTLADDLGVDPAPDTAAMELRLLRQDPSLLIPTPASPEAGAPVPRTSFVGRDGDLAALVERLARPGVVTLTGGPGSGKSRLSVEAARVVARGRSVTLVELAPLQREGAVRAAVADAAGAEPEDTAGCAAKLDGTLLVLDNAEHLVEQVAELVVALTARAGALTVLVTSQRPLLVGGEELHQVGPLAPAAGALLFEQRCAPDQAGSDPGAVAAICAAVDRLPLGIELAAGLTRTLTVRQLADRVEDRLRLLVGGGRDAGGRHTSLRAALDWSHDLLPERERAVLRRVSAFNGGFTLEAAEHVVPGDGLEPGDVAPALAELADRSLLAVDTGAGRRFGLLETVKDYARSRLSAAGEGEAVQQRHLTWCLEFVRQAGAGDDFATAEAVSALFAEWPNLLLALERAPGTERAAGGLRLAIALHTPWLIRGWYGEARRHFAALSCAPGATSAERLESLSCLGFVSTMVGRFDEAAATLATAAELALEVGDDLLTMNVLYYRGIVEIERGGLRAAFPPLLDGQELARRLEHTQRMSAFADALGTLNLYCGDAEAALDRYRAANALDRVAGDEHGLARGLSNEGQALLAMGRFAEAVERAAESDHYARRLDDRQILPLNEQVRGAAAQAQGDPATAERHLRAAVGYAVTDGVGATMAHIDLADALLSRAKAHPDALREAGELLGEVFAEAPEGSTPWLAARAVAASLALVAGERERAIELAEATASAYAASGFAWPRYATRLADVRARLDQP